MTATTLSPSLPAARHVSRLATVAIAGVAYFVVMIVALHFLRPDLNPIHQPTSRYAVGPYGFLMTTAFFSLSMAKFALVIGLSQGVSHSARSRLGLGLLGLGGVGVLIAMIFPMDVEGAPQTLAGAIHNISGPLTFLSLTTGLILVSRRFKQDDRWRPFYRAALVLSLILLAGFVATFLSFVTQSGFLGLAQRIMLAALVTWMVLTAARFRSVAPRSALD